MSNEAKWAHTDIYRCSGKNFMVEVTRRDVGASTYDSTGPYRWCVYAYIYPRHPYFASFDGDDIYQNASSQLHLHGGCSYLAYPMYDGNVTCVKIGADYNHLYDDCFTHYATPEHAYAVFSDAEELFEQLQMRAMEENDA